MQQLYPRYRDLTLDGSINYLRVRSLPNNGKGTIEFLFLIEQVKLIYTKFSESSTDWMSNLKSISLTYSAYAKSEAAGKSIVDFRFDENYSNAENNLFAILEKNQNDYSVFICKINFNTDPTKKDESINKIFRLDSAPSPSEVYSVYPDNFSDGDFSAYYKIYYSSKEGKVVLLGLNCNREQMDDKTEVIKFCVECKTLSRHPPPTQTFKSTESNCKSVFTSFNDKSTIDKILGTEAFKYTSLRNMS